MVGCGQKIDYTDPATYTTYVKNSFDEAKNSFIEKNPDIDLNQYADQAKQVGEKIKTNIEASVSESVEGLSDAELEKYYNDFVEKVDKFFDSLTADGVKSAMENFQNNLKV